MGVKKTDITKKGKTNKVVLRFPFLIIYIKFKFLEDFLNVPIKQSSVSEN